MRAGTESWGWVPTFLEQRYVNSDKTRVRMEAAWVSGLVFLRAHQIRSPRGMTRAEAMAFLPWRLSDSAVKAGLRKAKHNTALLVVFPRRSGRVERSDCLVSLARG